MDNAFTTIAEVFDDGEYQMVNLPEGFQFDAEEVWVQKIGNSVLLSPISKTEKIEIPAIK